MACIVTALGTVVLVYLAWRLLDKMLRLPSISNLQDKYFFITGCDTGFGNAIAKKLDRAGCHVFAACLTEKGEADVKIGASKNLKTVRMDVTKPASVRQAYAFVQSKLPQGRGLSGIVNNAGVTGRSGPVEWLKVDDYRSCLDVNTYGVIDVSTTFMPLVKKERGRIVNTASVLGRFAFPGAAPYVLSKYCVEAFSDVLRREIGDFGVTVHIIEPGFFLTNILNPDVMRRNVEQSWNQAPDHVKQDYGEEFMEKTLDIMINQFLKTIPNTDINLVVDAYYHALTAMFPRYRYVVGYDAKFIWLPIQALPEWIGDKLLDLAARDRPLPAACAVNCVKY